MREQGTFKVTEVLVPTPEEGDFVSGIPAPVIEGYENITLSQVELSGKTYDKFEFIPDWVNLCTDGNAKREGNLIRVINPAA